MALARTRLSGGPTATGAGAGAGGEGSPRRGAGKGGQGGGKDGSLGALAEPLLEEGDEEGGAGGGRGSDEQRLLAAITPLTSLDVVVLMMPSDEDGLRVTRLLHGSGEVLRATHQRQTTTPQLIVRLFDPAMESAIMAEQGKDFLLTTVVERAAMPDLIAEVMHPDCHWSHSLDNALDGQGQPLI